MAKLSKSQKKAMRHSDKPGAGAKARKHLRGKSKAKVVMKEWEQGTLRSGKDGVKIPKSRPDWAYAVAMSEAGLSRKKKKGKKRSKPSMWSGIK
mgnify:CR=1 FL=1